MKLSVELHSLESKDSLTLLKAIYKSLDDFKSVTKVDLDNIQITCTNSHRQMEQILGYKRPMWGGSTIKKGKIFLYNPRLSRKKLNHLSGLRKGMQHMLAIDKMKNLGKMS